MKQFREFTSGRDTSYTLRIESLGPPPPHQRGPDLLLRHLESQRVRAVHEGHYPYRRYLGRLIHNFVSPAVVPRVSKRVPWSVRHYRGILSNSLEKYVSKMLYVDDGDLTKDYRETIYSLFSIQKVKNGYPAWAAIFSLRLSASSVCRSLSIASEVDREERGCSGVYGNVTGRRPAIEKSIAK